MINEKYNELLQEIARIMIVKNVEISELKAEIRRLNELLADAKKRG